MKQHAGSTWVLCSLPMVDNAHVRQRLLTARILFGAMSVTPVMLAGLVMFTPALQPGPAAIPWLPQAFLVVALALAGASFLVPERARRNAMEALRPHITREEIVESDVLNYRDGGKLRSVLRLTKPVSQLLFGGYQTSMIMSLALSEAIGVLGLGVAPFSPTIAWPLGFLVASWVLILVRFPTAGRIIAPVEEALNARRD